MCLIVLLLCKLVIQNILYFGVREDLLNRIKKFYVYFEKTSLILSDNIRSESAKRVFNLPAFLKTIDVGTLITGIIVPIITAILAYTLVESANRRKEKNRLLIELYWIQKEIEENKVQFDEFIIDNMRWEKAHENLKYPSILDRNLLINLLEKIDAIHQDYPIIFGVCPGGEHSVKLIELHGKYEKNEKYMSDLNEDFGSYADMPPQKKKDFDKLKIEQADLVRQIEAKIRPGETIFEKLDMLSYYLESQKKNDVISKNKNENEDNAVECLDYFRDALKDYKKISSPTLLDAANTLKKLYVDSSKIDVFQDVSDQDELCLETRKICVENCSEQERTIIGIYENYILWKKLDSKIKNFEYHIIDVKWKKFQDDLVLINNRETYFKIAELYDRMTGYEKDLEKINMIITDIEEVLERVSRLERKFGRGTKG